MSGAELQVRLYVAGLKGVGMKVNGGSIAFLSSEASKVVHADVDNKNETYECIIGKLIYSYKKNEVERNV